MVIIDGKLKGKIFLGILVIIGIIVLLSLSKFWVDLDKAMTPYVQYDRGAFSNATSSGSADAVAITNIRIAWESGNVAITYSPQERITWVETFVEGEPTQFNSQSYWMNSHTLFIEFRNQEYFAMDEKTNHRIRKDLLVTIPKGCVLDELVVHNFDGKVVCEVEARKKEIRMN